MKPKLWLYHAPPTVQQVVEDNSLTPPQADKPRLMQMEGIFTGRFEDLQRTTAGAAAAKRPL